MSFMPQALVLDFVYSPTFYRHKTLVYSHLIYILKTRCSNLYPELVTLLLVFLKRYESYCSG